MYIDLPEIKNKKKVYRCSTKFCTHCKQMGEINGEKCSHCVPDVNSLLESNFKTYLDIAKKTISYFAPKLAGSTLAKEMLASEDAVSNVAYSIAQADWDWKVQEGCRSRKAYRNQHAFWAIQNYITRKANDKQAIPFSAFGKYDTNMLSFIEDKSQDTSVSVEVEDIIQGSGLSEKEEKFIRYHYLESRTMTDIGKEYGICTERVSQVIKKGLMKMQKLVNIGDR